MTDPQKMALSATPLLFYIGAAVGLILGWPTSPLVLLIVGILITVGIEIINRRDTGGPLPVITAEEAAELRAERERSGEVAAVKRLRMQHRQLPVTDAIRMVRGL